MKILRLRASSALIGFVTLAILAVLVVGESPRSKPTLTASHKPASNQTGAQAHSAYVALHASESASVNRSAARKISSLESHFAVFHLQRQAHAVSATATDLSTIVPTRMIARNQLDLSQAQAVTLSGATVWIIPGALGLCEANTEIGGQYGVSCSPTAQAETYGLLGEDSLSPSEPQGTDFGVVPNGVANVVITNPGGQKVVAAVSAGTYSVPAAKTIYQSLQFVMQNGTDGVTVP